MDIDDEFKQRRGGRRATDAPTVPLRDHLETLIRGVRTELHLEITDVAAKVDEVSRELHALTEDTRSRFHKLVTDVAALRLLEERRRGERDAHAGARAWVQWVPSVVAAFAAVYAVFFA